MAQPDAARIPAQLSGTLESDGIVLVTDEASSTGLPSPPPETGTLDTIHSSNASDQGSEDAIESYDDLELNPDVLASNARQSLDASYRPAFTKDQAEQDGQAEGKSNDTSASQNPSSSAARHRKRGSLQVRLERTGKNGRYVLTADDPETKEILRRGLERESADSKSSKARTRIRDLVFTRQFTTFDRQNASAAQGAFFGFFTLFWICMGFIFVNSALKNYREYGSILGPNQVLRLMLRRDVLVLGLTDGAMFAATFEGYLFQRLVAAGYIDWARSGWIIQNIWQTAFLASVIGWTYYRDWPWTHTIFITLHGLVFLMKQHSYGFYNGYLSSVYRRKTLLERKLAQLEAMEPQLLSGPTSPASPRDKMDFTSASTATGYDLTELGKAADTSGKRRPSMNQRTSTNFHTEQSPVAAVAAAIESGRAIDSDQMQVFSSIIQAEITDLATELKGKSEDGKYTYPKNLTLANHAEYICFPTLVYELDYPRQESTNWWYIVEKTAATFGVLCIMQVVSQAFIYPVVMQTVKMKDAGMTIDQRWIEFPFIMCDLLFPMLIEQLLTWYVIWECILNVLAEVTRFADRGFYGDWWNSVTWDQYARDWNRPVHNFLLRHVYFSSISTFHFSRSAATFATFFLSALVHELCMALIFKRVRGYLFAMQLMQIPLVSFGRSKFMKGRVVLGNTIFWLGLFMGPSVLTSLYLII